MYESWWVLVGVEGRVWVGSDYWVVLALDMSIAVATVYWGVFCKVSIWLWCIWNERKGAWR
jgi:hypothetical protein